MITCQNASLKNGKPEERKLIHRQHKSSSTATTTEATHGLRTQKTRTTSHKLDQANERFTQKDKALFAKLVDAYAKHDTAHANMYATELAEVRKMTKLIMNASLALDQVTQTKNLHRIRRHGRTLGPAIGVLRSVSTCIGGVLPEAENELGEIGNMLSGLMFDAGSTADQA